MCPNLLFVPASSFFFLILLVHSFFETFFNVFSCSKENNGENILQNSESLVAITHDGNCCEDLVFSSRQELFCLRFTIFLLCK